MSYIITFAYCCLVSFAYGSVFRKKFSESLAPAFFIQILIMLASGILLHHIWIGIAFEVLAAVGISVWTVWNRIRTSQNEPLVSRRSSVLNDTGFLVFVLFFIFVVYSNMGKNFDSFDEFSHWGIFLKESIRLDDLYCVSDKTFVHKDYVPAITLFEALWCKLSGRYLEADAYRSVQIFQFAMILPMLGSTDETSAEIKEGSARAGKWNVSAVYIGICKAFFVMLVFLLDYGASFYHTIYQDMIFSFLIFYCMYVANRNYSDRKYNYFLLTMSLTVLLLCKMTAVVFLPMIVVYYIVKSILGGTIRQEWKRIIVGSAAPAVVWFLVNQYIAKYVPKTTSTQSYSGITLKSVVDVISHNGAIVWQKDVEKQYIHALLKDIIFGQVSYVITLCGLIAFVFLIACLEKDKTDRQNILLLNLWILLAGIAYAVLMYFLYMISFGEYEARMLASFSRYMNSYLFVAVLLTISVMYHRRVWNRTGTATLFCVCFLGIMLHNHPDCFVQMEPQWMVQKEDDYKMCMTDGQTIVKGTEDAKDASVCCIVNGSAVEIGVRLNYYANPDTVACISIDPDYADNIYNYSQREFVKQVSESEYLYIIDMDEEFIQKYGNVFEDSNVLKQGNFIKISVENGKITADNCENYS